MENESYVGMPDLAESDGEEEDSGGGDSDSDNEDMDQCTRARVSVSSRENPVIPCLQHIGQEDTLNKMHFPHIPESKIHIKVNGQSYLTQLDSGNTVSGGLVISETLHNSLDVGFRETLDEEVTTANGKMKTLGVSNAVQVTIPGVKTMYRMYPRVMTGLSSPTNLGMDFLKQTASGISCRRRNQPVLLIRDKGIERVIPLVASIHGNSSGDPVDQETF
ncbi:hypothetical protein, partial [Litorimonas sp.]|uniref:hypothetical protein n=1 Tax=Litorimonas sp. TaxID=1892381 RepID=UPI003A86818D